jgi:hypothetical protein
VLRIHPIVCILDNSFLSLGRAVDHGETQLGQTQQRSFLSEWIALVTENWQEIDFSHILETSVTSHRSLLDQDRAKSCRRPLAATIEGFPSLRLSSRVAEAFCSLPCMTLMLLLLKLC